MLIYPGSGVVLDCIDSWSLHPYLLSFFSISRSCQLGDPLSPYIFINFPEFISIKVRNNKSTKGKHISNLSIRFHNIRVIHQCFSIAQKTSWNVMLKELGDFANISGLKLTLRRHNLYGFGLKDDTSSIKTKWKLLWGRETFKLLACADPKSGTPLENHKLYGFL